VYRLNVLPGDVNGDGKVSSADVNVMRNQPLSLTDNSSNWHYDVNGAGKVSAADVNIVRSQPLATITGFPEPILPGTNGGAVAPAAVSSSGGITVTSGTLSATNRSEIPAGTSPTVGAVARIGGDLAWWMAQDQHQRKDAAIPALDAVFAQYGP
jgi:hypothetical protein